MAGRISAGASTRRAGAGAGSTHRQRLDAARSRQPGGGAMPGSPSPGRSGQTGRSGRAGQSQPDQPGRAGQSRPGQPGAPRSRARQLLVSARDGRRPNQPPRLVAAGLAGGVGSKTGPGRGSRLVATGFRSPAEPGATADQAQQSPTNWHGLQKPRFNPTELVRRKVQRTKRRLGLGLAIFAFLLLGIPLGFSMASVPSPVLQGANPGGPIGGAMGCPTPVEEVSRRTSIPMEALSAYCSGAARYRMDWAILAAVGKRECDHGRNGGLGCYPRGTVNEAGARGPMQFLGSTWDGAKAAHDPEVARPPIPDGQEGLGYATDGNADNVADPWVWLDATHAAARLLTTNNVNDDVDKGLRAYNPSQDYVDAVKVIADSYRKAVADMVGPLLGGDCPVAGPVSFSNDWGDPRSGGLSHLGNDMFANEGTPVIAHVDGRVEHDQNGKGGLVYRLYTDDGAVFYGAHLSRYGTQGDVVAGTVVGYVGHTGDAQGTPNHLHFEIWPAPPGKRENAINPYDHISEWCKENRDFGRE